MSLEKNCKYCTKIYTKRCKPCYNEYMKNYLKKQTAYNSMIDNIIDGSVGNGDIDFEAIGDGNYYGRTFAGFRR